MARCWMAATILACSNLANLTSAPGGQGPVSEYQARAAIVIQLARFVEWPPEAWASSREFTFCVSGDDRLFNQLETAAGHETIVGRPARVRRITRPGEMTGCRVIVLGAGSDHHMAEVTEPTLTISTEAGFADSGGMIELSADRGSLSFQINLKTAANAKLRFSSRLLALASNMGRKTAR